MLLSLQAHLVNVKDRLPALALKVNLIDSMNIFRSFNHFN